MLLPNNNILNMLNLGNQFNPYFGFNIGNQCGEFNNFNIFGDGFGGYATGGICCNKYDYDSKSGFLLGQSLATIAIAAIGSLTGEVKANSKMGLLNSANNIKANLEKIKETFEAEKKVNESYVAEQKACYETMGEQYKIMKNIEPNLNKYRETKQNYPADLAALQNKFNAATTDEEKAGIKKEIENLEYNYNLVCKQIKMYEEATTQYNKAKEKADDLKEKIQASLKKLDAYLKEFETQLEQHSEKVDNLGYKLLNDVDGNFLTRVSDEKFESVVKHDESTGELTVDGEVDERFANRAVKRYAEAKKAGDKEGMEKAKAEFMAVYNKLDDKDAQKVYRAYKLLNI